MKFNNILPTESTQKDVFLLVEDSIRQFLHGINTTIFAYGQTGAGKTYSIIGNYSPNENQDHLYNFLSSKERGVLSRSL
jgi:kinesin family protein 15